MKIKELLTLMSIMLVTTMTAQTNRLDSRALWASINGVKNASLGDYQTHTGKVLVTWRMLPSDDANTSFDLYRTIGTEAEQLIASDIKATNYQDNSANKSSDNTYRLTYAGRNETLRQLLECLSGSHGTQYTNGYGELCERCGHK